MRELYTLVMYVLTPVILYRLAARGLRARGYFSRWFERFAFFEPPAVAGTLWVHAVSVGEVNAAAVLIDALLQRYPGRDLVVTTVTPTGSDRVRQLWGDRIFHVYLPYDLPASVRRFIDRIDPAIAVIMETEIWPNLFLALAARDIPIVVANARLSNRSLRGYGPVRPLARMAIRCATHVLAQSPQDGFRLQELGARTDRLEVAGNLKYELRIGDALLQRARAARETLGVDRPVWIAASTHEGEEQLVLDAHSRVLARFPDALLLIAPRHPERFRPVSSLIAGLGFATGARSQVALPTPAMQCFVVDTMGELLDFVALADVAFVGGSFVPIGGHNVLEAAALGVPTLVGPETFNFEEVTALLAERGGLAQLSQRDELGPALIDLLEDDSQRVAMGQAARLAMAAERGALSRTLAVIDRLLLG